MKRSNRRSRSGLLLSTIRHLKPWQVFGRLYAPIHRRWLTKVPEWTAPESFDPPEAHFPLSAHDPWNRQEDLLAGQFTFLNDTRSLAWPPDWHAADAPLLWRFNLHYFNYLHLLPSTEQTNLCKSWIEDNPVGEGTGWHPYPISLRLCNWCKVSPSDPLIIESLHQQAAFLYRNLETYVGGNHLLENARALVLAGWYLASHGEANDWFRKGLLLLIRELDEQVLGDGGHYERSPMYHALMLDLVLDVLCVLAPDARERPHIEKVAARMSAALFSMTHPSGDLALFNDSTSEIAPAAKSILTRAHSMRLFDALVRRSLPETGYHVFERDGLSMIIDGGNPGPDHLLAHAHADTFSFELQFMGRALITDTGVYNYENGEEREYDRSSLAHNTITVDDADHIECWDRFRVGRRSRAAQVSLNEDAHGFRFNGRFDAYDTPATGTVSLERVITWDSRERRLLFNDRASGEGAAEVNSRLHLAPDVETALDGNVLEFSNGDVNGRITSLDGEMTLEDGWYSPEFGKRLPRAVINMGGRSALPVTRRYSIEFL